jgi:polysaccharide chain length determinant protein (PEP-CTERM system associated)
MVGALIALIYDEVRKIWCYRWLALATSTLLLLLAAAFVLTRPSIYDAWGQIYVNKQTAVSTATTGMSLVGDSYGSPKMVARTLLNDQNLERVIDKLYPGAIGRLSKAEMAGAVASLKNQIVVTGDDEDGFFEFHVKDPDPVRAQRVVDLLLQEFVSRNVNRNQQELHQAGQFLQTQIASYESMIASSKARIADFQRRNPGFAPVLTVDTSNAPDAGAARAAYETLVAQRPARGPGAAAAAARVAELRSKLAGLRTEYTEQYPDVVSMKRQLADAEAEAEAERLRPADADPALAAARQRMFAAQRGGGGRAARPSPSPELQAEWADLQKSDDMLRINYQQLIGKREGARMAQALYGADGSGKYQITRLPTVPEIPIGPNRPLFLGIAIAASLIGGVGVAYLRAAMDGVFVAPRELEQSFQLPVVGTVSWEPAWSTAAAANPGTLAAVRAAIGRAWRRGRPGSRTNLSVRVS